MRIFSTGFVTLKMMHLNTANAYLENGNAHRKERLKRIYARGLLSKYLEMGTH